MKEFIGLVEENLKSFLKDKVNRLMLVTLIGFTALFIIMGYEFNQLDNIKRKIDHRYFNITNSLQDIHNVEIDTYKGRVIKHY